MTSIIKKITTKKYSCSAASVEYPEIILFGDAMSYAKAPSLTSNNQFIEIHEVQLSYYSSVDDTQPDQADAVSGTTINPV
jgi:hypothetical protein